MIYLSIREQCDSGNAERAVKSTKVASPSTTLHKGLD